MPASLTRNEYYWRNDRLVQERSFRSSIYSRWRLHGSELELVATTEDRRNQKKITTGPAATSIRIAHAVLRDERLHVSPSTPDIGANVPDELIQHAASRVQDSVKHVTDQHQRLSNEERRTGALQFALNRYGVIEYGGWQLTIILQGFAANPKEKATGADLGIVVDLRYGKEQVSKGLWVQAKQADVFPDDPLKLPDLKNQMELMLRRTDDAYGLIYTPNGVVVFRGQDGRQRTTLERVIADVTACQRGDRDPEFLCDTIHRDLLVEIAFERPQRDRSQATLARE